MTPREQTLTRLLSRACDELNAMITGDSKAGDAEELVCDIEDALGLERSE